MVAKVPDIAPTVDILLANLEDAIPAADKEAARAGLVEVGQDGRHRATPSCGPGSTASTRRGASTTSPPLVTEVGDKLDVIMIPKVEGPRTSTTSTACSPSSRPRPGSTEPLLVHAILETARGVANVEEICAASPRMQGLSLGPADLAANRRMKTTRVGGGHPGYLVRAGPRSGDDPTRPGPPTSRTCGTTRSPAWSTPAWRTGILPFYGPFGDIKDTVACEDQFRNAYLLGCVGAWSLHPVQIDIAKRVFSPDPADVAHAQRVIEAMGDGTGRDHARRQDGGRRLGQAVPGHRRPRPAARRPRPRAGRRLRVRVDDADRRPAPAPLGALHAGRQRAGAREGQAIPADALIFDLEDAVAPDAKADARAQASPRRASGEYGDRELTIRCNGLDTQWGADDLAAAAAVRRGRRRGPEGQARSTTSTRSSARSRRPARRTMTAIWAMVETPTAIFDAARSPPTRASPCS